MAILCCLPILLGFTSTRAVAAELRGTIDLDQHASSEELFDVRELQAIDQVEFERRLRPALKNWSSAEANRNVVLKPEQVDLGLSYSIENGLAYRYSDLTHFNLGLDVWSVQVGISRRLPVPARGAKTQSFW